MKTIVLNIPESVELNDREARMLLASRLYEQGKLTLGQGAEMTGLSKSTFMELLTDYDVKLINHSSADLDTDIENAKKYSI
jgi:predicted HTH domain antitoxin